MGDQNGTHGRRPGRNGTSPGAVDPQSGAARGQLLQTVGRALEVLEAVVSRDHWNATQLALHLGIRKSVLLRILATLGQYKFVDYSQPEGVYRAGERLWSLAGQTLRSTDLRTVARPFLARLVERCGETAVLTVARNGWCVYVDAVPSPHPLRVMPEIGSTQPLHLGAPARVLLAYLPAAEVRAYLEERADEIAASGSRVQEIWLDLARIQREGYVFSVGEHEPGAFSLGVPLLDRAGRLIAGIAVAGPRTRWEPERLPGLLEELRSAARDIAFLLQEADPLTGQSAGAPVGAT
ncbi:MAG: IclR family transcriptional regulator [Clostridia bacterium]|nr:IclR family transcriptional regulator [Clostridia bacterium]